MATRKRPRAYVDSIPDTNIQNYRRSQWFENAKIVIQIALMWALAVALIAFLILVLVAGITRAILPDTEGVQALSALFVEIAQNAKAVGLFALGFFFREYLLARGMNGK
jgi:hypothetical protein